MPTVLAQSNLPKSAAVVVSSETIILRDPSNSILEKYTSDEQKQKSLKSYGIKPKTLLSPGENKTSHDFDGLVFHRWLQNVNNAYIDTGIVPLTSYKFEFSAIRVSGSQAYIYGARILHNADTREYYNFSGRLVVGSGNTPLYRLYWKAEGTGYLDIRNADNDFLDVIIDKGNVFVDGVSKGIIPDFNENIVINVPICLFAFGENPNPTFSGTVKIAYFKIYDENGILLRDFVPATKDEEVGMFDKVSKTLFLNKNNVGNFVAGDDDTVSQVLNTFGFGNVNTPDDIGNDFVTE